MNNSPDGVWTTSKRFIKHWALLLQRVLRHKRRLDYRGGERWHNGTRKTRLQCVGLQIESLGLLRSAPRPALLLYHRGLDLACSAGLSGGNRFHKVLCHATASSSAARSVDCALRHGSKPSRGRGALSVWSLHNLPLSASVYLVQKHALSSAGGSGTPLSVSEWVREWRVCDAFPKNRYTITMII